jgi:hypothetical protein
MGNDSHHTGFDGELTRTNAVLYMRRLDEVATFLFDQNAIHGND